MAKARLSVASLVACVFAVACGTSQPEEPLANGGNANAGGSRSEVDGAGGGGQGQKDLSEAAVDGLIADSAAPNGAVATADGTVAPKDASRDGSVFSGLAKIMVLGSSNESATCWRALLWQKLRASSITNFDFVGSQNVGPDCGVAGYDKDCEARPGTVITSITADTYRGWFAAYPPDIVLMHIGGADLLNNIPAANVIKTYTVIVEQARTVNPRVIFLVAQHTPQEPTGCADCRANVIALNTAIPGWAMQTTTPQSSVTPVDLFTGLDVVTDFSDRVHLNTAGSEKVSDRWLLALVPLFKP
jgi:hypothetical protein